MRKYIHAVLVFFSFFSFTGCGGGSDNISNVGDVISTAAIEATVDEMEINGSDFNLSILLTKKVDSSYQIELSNFNLSTDSCTLKQAPIFNPNVLNMNGGINSTAIVNISGTFTEACASTGYTFSATQKATKDGIEDVRMFSVTYTAGDSGGTVTPVPSSGFFNATTPMEITQTDTAYEIKVQVVEDGYAAVGKIVKVKVFDDIYGTISNPETTTGSDGYAVFNYLSPEALPANGTSATIVLTHDDNGTIITQDIVLNFNNTGLPAEPPVDTSSYVLYAVPSAINISSNDTGKVLDLYLADTDLNVPVSGQVITAQFFDPNNGTLNQYTATTDSVGHVAFEYTRPEIFTVGNSFDITFDVLGGTVIKSAMVSVTFTTASFDYIFTNETPLLISYATQEEELSVYLVDSDNVGVPGKEISISTIPNAYGSVSSSKTVTDASGKATFNYTAPDELDTSLFGTSTVATFSFTEAGTTITQDVGILLSSAAIESEYSLVNPAPELDVTIPNQTAVLDIQLIRTIDGNDIPVLNPRPCDSSLDNTISTDCVIPAVIPREYGRITGIQTSNGLDVQDGYIYFDYLGPEDGAPGPYAFEVYYIDENGKIAATGILSVNVNIVP